MGTDADLRLVPIGIIRTAWKTLADCPRAPRDDAAPSTIELFPEYAQGLFGMRAQQVDLFYWFDRAARDVLRSVSPHDGVERGVFAMRSPHRPNPVAHSRLALHGIAGNLLTVGGLDCLDGTSLIDIKPVPRG